VSRQYFLQFGLGVIVSATLTLAGCASSTNMASNAVPGLTSRQAPEEVLAGSAQNVGFWNRAKSWMPKAPTGMAAEKPVQNPGKLHLAYARWQETLGNLVEARESYELALGDNPKSADAILGLARLDQLNNRNFEAEQRFLKALKLKPNDPNVLDAVGQYYATQERWDRSIELLTQAVQITPQDTTHRFNLAVAMARAGRVNEAMPHFSQTVGDAEAHYNVGYILYQQNDLIGAERHLLQAVVSHPELTQAQEMLDQVRSDQADRTMFADGRRPAATQRPVASQQPATSRQASNFRRNEPTREPYIQAGHRADNTYRAEQRYRDVRPTAPAVENAPQDYRRQYQQRPAATEDRVRTDGAIPSQTNGRRSPPPWHTSAAFDRAPATSRRQIQQPPQANGSPAANQPTPEQLEQWRNQLSPGNGGRGY
jgi:tetratricopeptide (TPR) repeat protein